MARLEAKAKCGYYPTPPVVTEIIAGLVKPAPNSVVLDPCAGEGIALATLCAHWKAIGVGCELDKDRALACQERGLNVLWGPIEFLQVEGEADVLFLNPPYDVNPHSGVRQEREFLELATPWLTPGGILIYLIPQSTITDVAYILAEGYSSLAAYRFPDPEFEQFSQIVVVGIKRAMLNEHYWMAAHDLQRLAKNPLVLATSSFEPYQAPGVPAVPKVSMRLPGTMELLEEAVEHGVTTTEVYRNFLVEPHRSRDLRPILPLSGGYSAFAIAGGLMRSVEVTDTDTGHPLLIRGLYSKSLKTLERVEATASGGTKVQEIARESLVTEIVTLDTVTCKVKTYSSKDPDEFRPFLEKYQGEFVKAVEREHPALFVPSRDMDRWAYPLALVHGPRELPGLPTNGLLPAQAVCAAGLATHFKSGQKAALLAGEMGTGKTAISIATLGALINGKHVVVMCPAQVCDKWAEETEAMLKEFGIRAIVVGKKRGNGRGKPILDVQRAFDGPPCFIIVSYEVAKNDAPWEHVCKLVTRKVTTRRVEERAWSWQGRVEYVETEVKSIATCPDCGLALADKDGQPWETDTQKWGRSKRFCPHCGAALFTQRGFTYGGRKAVAWFINKHYARRYHLIIDECHHTSGGDTDIGQASQLLISAAQRVLTLTGTPYKGKAGSIFYVLYRLVKEFRESFSFSDVEKFVALHGLSETVKTRVYKPGRSYTSSWGYERQDKKVREIAGVTPGIVIWLLNMMARIRLEDLGVHLPPYKESRIPVALDDRLQEYYRQIERAREDARRAAGKGKMGLLSAWLHLAMAGLDCPVEDTIEDEDSRITLKGVLESPDELLDPPLAKDQVIVDTIAEHLARGRGVGVFFEQVNRRPWMSRIRKLLEKQGIYSEELKAQTVEKADRMEWYRSFVNRCRSRGQEPVLLSSGDLLKEGVDLIELPTILEVGINFKVNPLRQRDRRSWRLGQDKPVEVIFIYYEDTFCADFLGMIARKIKAAQGVEGDLATGLAEEMGGEDDLMDSLMRAVMRDAPAERDWGDMGIAVSPNVPLLARPAPPKKLVALVQAEAYRQLSLF